MEYYLYENYRRLALNLINFRKSTRLDQIDFAKKCGLSRYQYLRLEGGQGKLTLESLLKICHTFQIEIGDLFKDPFIQSLKLELREKVKVNNPSSKIKEEKFLSSLNKNMIIKRWVFGREQVRSIRLEKTTKIEILVLKGEVYFASNAESKILTEGQQISLDFNPQWSFEEKATEHIKLGSSFGAEVLLIQTVVH